MTRYVYILTLPSDDHTEPHVFEDHALARKVADAVEGAVVNEQAIMDEAFANQLIEAEADGEPTLKCDSCGHVTVSGEDGDGCPKCDLGFLHPQ